MHAHTCKHMFLSSFTVTRSLNQIICTLNDQVAILLLTEITPKSIAVHNATEVARIVVSSEVVPL